ncbi:hypothetical protein TWF281_001950 [Arthrobotrys megalospora]
MENAGPADAASPPPLLHLSTLPTSSLPTHLRHPSNPPPTGPLPRPPSILENREIGARLSASSSSSPLLSSSIRPKLTVYPFPTISETNKQHPLQSSTLSPHNASTPNTSSTNQLSPSISLPNNGNSSSSSGRQLSAHTQASSDALGENYTHSRPITLPPVDQNSRKSSAISTDYSRYSGSSILASYEEAGPNKPASTSHRGQSVVSLEELQHDSRCLSRLSRLSYISGGAAFVVSEESEGLQRNNSRSYRINNVLPDFEGHASTHQTMRNTHDSTATYDLHINTTLGSPGDSKLRVHPADNRFEHTYRMRKATEEEEPIYVPVYSFEPPGKFPDRSRLTAPLATPKFINHTPRNFSLPGRADMNPPPRSSSDSAEMLLGNTGKFDGIGQEIQVPPRAYDTQRRTLRPFRNPLARKPQVTTSNVQRGIQIKDGGQLFGKETAHQRFEREHSHYFHDLDHLEESRWPAAPVPPRIQVHGPKYSFSKYGVPTLGRPQDAYTGKEINESLWPDRHKRQKRIGRSMLCICIAMPPLWLIMAVGLLDNLVAEMTSGEIWGVGRSEKVLAAWFGGIFCFALIVTIIVVGIVVL